MSHSPEYSVRQSTVQQLQHAGGLGLSNARHATVANFDAIQTLCRCVDGFGNQRAHDAGVRHDQDMPVSMAIDRFLIRRMGALDEILQRLSPLRTAIDRIFQESLIFWSPSDLDLIMTQPFLFSESHFPEARFDRHWNAVTIP